MNSHNTPETPEKDIPLSPEFRNEFGNLFPQDPDYYAHAIDVKPIVRTIDDDYLAYLLLRAPRATWEHIANMRTFSLTGDFAEFEEDFDKLCAYFDNPDYTRENLLEDAEFPGILTHMADKFPKTDTITEHTRQHSDHIIRID